MPTPPLQSLFDGGVEGLRLRGAPNDPGRVPHEEAGGGHDHPALATKPKMQWACNPPKPLQALHELGAAFLGPWGELRGDAFGESEPDAEDIHELRLAVEKLSGAFVWEGHGALLLRRVLLLARKMIEALEHGDCLCHVVRGIRPERSVVDVRVEPGTGYKLSEPIGVCGRVESGGQRRGGAALGEPSPRVTHPPTNFPALTTAGCTAHALKRVRAWHGRIP